MRRLALAALLLALLPACSTISTLTIADRLGRLGLDQERANCMAGRLEEDLDAAALSRLANFLDRLTAEDRPADIVRAAERLADRDIAAAIAAASIGCLFE